MPASPAQGSIDAPVLRIDPQEVARRSRERRPPGSRNAMADPAVDRASGFEARWQAGRPSPGIAKVGIWPNRLRTRRPVSVNNEPI